MGGFWFHNVLRHQLGTHQPISLSTSQSSDGSMSCLCQLWPNFSDLHQKSSFSYISEDFSGFHITLIWPVLCYCSSSAAVLAVGVSCRFPSHCSILCDSDQDVAHSVALQWAVQEGVWKLALGSATGLAWLSGMRLHLSAAQVIHENI